MNGLITGILTHWSRFVNALIRRAEDRVNFCLMANSTCSAGMPDMLRLPCLGRILPQVLWRAWLPCSLWELRVEKTLIKPIHLGKAECADE